MEKRQFLRGARKRSRRRRRRRHFASKGGLVPESEACLAEHQKKQELEEDKSKS